MVAIISLPPFTDSERFQRVFLVISQIETVFKEFAEQNRVPGLVFGIVVDRALAYADAFGLRNVAEKVPTTIDSVFRIASMTKSITAMCIIKLRDVGKLRLDDPVADYVPELAALPYPTTDSAPITIRQLLTMSAGFPQDDPWADRQLALADAHFSELMSGGISFSNPPGVVYEYSNYGYAILGRIVTNVAGIPYQTYAMQNILGPLGMTSSTFDVHRVPPERLAMGYRREADAWAEEPPLADGAFAPMGGLFTTIPDFARYMALLLSAFPPRDDPEGEPLRRSSLREMQQYWRHNTLITSRLTPDSPSVIQSNGYGYGLACAIDSVLGYSVSHGGGLPGYGTFYRLLPDYGLGVVAFTNLTYASPAVAVNDALRLLKNSESIKPRVRSTSPALLSARDKIAALYDQWDDQEVQALAIGSFFLDMPLEKRREQFEKLRADLGARLSMTDLQPENELRGRWKMTCERGNLELFMTLAPTVPPRVQFLHIVVAKPLSPTLRKAVWRMMRLIRAWDDHQFRTLFGLRTKRKLIHAQFKALEVQYGGLKTGDVLESDGQNWARIRLIGQHGAVDMRLALKPGSDRVAELTFSRPEETAFML